MKIVCTKANIREAFQTAERFTGKNLTLPVLGNIFFEADDKKVRCMATNLEMGVEIVIPGKVIKGGSVTIPSRVINTIIQSIDEDNVVIEEKDSSVTFNTDSSNFVLQGISAKDFPTIPKVKKNHSFTVRSRDLQEGLSQVLPAVSASDFKPELAGVFVKKDKTTLTLAATDSFRLAEKTITSQSQDEAVSFIVPARTCQEILRTFSDKAEETKVVEGENQALFEVGDVNIVSRLVDGTYPDYVSIIPKNFETHLSMDREDLIRKIKSASALSSKLNDVTVNCSSKDTFIEASNSELGRSHIQIPAKTKGKDCKVSFNFRYLLDGLEALSGDEAVISFNGESSPALITDPNDATFRYVLMPIRNS